MPQDAPLFSGSSIEAGVQIGDFRIERRLGAGGMGIVYQARQVSLNRLVALKVLGQALTQDTDVARFQREAQAAARLRHPSIAQVYFIGQDRHLCFLAMELVEGISLRGALDRMRTATSHESGIDSTAQEEFEREPHAQQVRFDLPTENFEVANGGDNELPPSGTRTVSLSPYLSPIAREQRAKTLHVRRCCEIIRDAARALAHAHEQGVVHRDIKPDNLLLDREGQVHLIDFGVARFFDDQAITYTGQLVGTPLYMSPEQVSGRGNIDSRTDIYALGLVLYELLTLRPAVEATNRENLLRSIVTKPLVPITWRNSAIPAELERVVHRATQKDPDERYSTAADLAADLDNFLAGKPVVAPVYRFRLDEREITAARPGDVVLAAFIFFVVSSVLFLGFAAAGITTGFFATNLNELTMAGIQSLAGLAILAVGVAIGRGLLAGRAWARWSGVGFALLICFAFLALMIAFGLTVARLERAVEIGTAPRYMSDAKSMDGVEPAYISEDSRSIERRIIYRNMSTNMLPAVLGLILGGTALWSLLTRDTAAWYRFARSIREEHRLLRHELE